MPGAVVPVAPTVVANVDPASPFSQNELFGPAVAVSTAEDWEAAIAQANGTGYGLAAGVFTGDVAGAVRAMREIDAGSIHVNWTPLWRADLMPYGGLKGSGIGKEGPRSAVEEMTGDLGRSPTVDELAARLDLRREQVLEGLEASSVYSALSLDGLQGVDPADENESRTNDVLDRQVLAGLLERLPKRERRILYLRYFHEMSQAQIAEQIGTSQVHVGRLIAASLTSLRELVEERDA